MSQIVIVMTTRYMALLTGDVHDNNANFHINKQTFE